MRRGTTPTITITTDIDLTPASNLFVTFKQDGCKVVEKTLDDVTVTAESVVVPLSQADTLVFDSTKQVKFQIRATLGDDKVASNVMSATVTEILKQGEI